MKITRVDFYGSGKGNFLTYSTIVIDGGLVVRGLKLIKREAKDILVAMPTRKKVDDTHEETVYPTNHEARRLIEEAVLNAWRKIAD